MTKDKILMALENLYPDGFNGLDPKKPTPSSYSEYVDAVKPGYTVHTEAELSEAKDRAEAEEAAQIAYSQIRAELRKKWEALPDFIQGPYRDTFDAANALLDDDKKAAAVELVELTEPKIGFTPTELLTFQEVKEEFVAAFKSL